MAHSIFRLALGVGLMAPCAVLAAGQPVASTCCVFKDNFLSTSWDQNTPYNDYMPVYSQSEFGTQLSGRCHAGCVPVAYAQIMAYWKWPTLFDAEHSSQHTVYPNASTTGSVTYRVSGAAPVNWELVDWLDRTKVGQLDIHGRVFEQTRYDVARLLLLAGSYAGCYYGSKETGAAYYAPANNPWYAPSRAVLVDKANYTGDNWEEFLNPLRDALTNGCPVLVSLPGHAVVGCGWAEDDTTCWIYLNYGMGGTFDGWYPLDKSLTGTLYNGCVLGYVTPQMPSLAPQLEKLPTVVTTSPLVKWRLADCHADKVSGFSLNIAERAALPSEITDNFSTVQGKAYGVDATVGYANTYLPNTPGKTLRLRTGSGWSADEKQVAQSCSYVYSEPFVITAQSQLSFALLAAGHSGYELSIVLTEMNGETTILDTPKPPSSTISTASWSTKTYPLGHLVGKTVRLSFVSTYNSGTYNSGDCQGFFIKNLSLSAVVPFARKRTVTGIASSAREQRLSNLSPGTHYLFSVTVHTADDAATSESECVTTEGVATVYVPFNAATVEHTSTFALDNDEWTSSYASGKTIYLNNVPYQPLYPTDTKNGSVDIQLDGILPTTTFRFSYMAKFYTYNSSFNARLQFTDTTGVTTTLWSPTFTEPILTWTPQEINLGALAGKSGRLSLSFTHTYPTITLYAPSYGLYLQPDSVVCGPYLKAVGSGVSTEQRTLTAHPFPEIVAVTCPQTNLVENLLLEVGLSTPTRFTVRCSPETIALTARASCPSLLPDSAVSVAVAGDGCFEVTLSPTRMKYDGNDRTRMILTLTAADTNGSRASKDLVLRFTAANNRTQTTPCPVRYGWLVENRLGCAYADGAAVFEAAALRDDDNDGCPNWKEYLIGTGPNAANENRLTAFITLENGKPRLSWEPDLSPARVYRKLGTSDLENWQLVTDEAASGFNFFKIEVGLE